MADMFVIGAAVSCTQTVIGAMTVALRHSLLPTAQVGALPLCTWLKTDILEVIAAIVVGDAILVTTTTWSLLIKRLIASAPA